MKMCIERGRRVWWPHEQLAILVNKNVRSGSQEAHQCQKCGAGLRTERRAVRNQCDGWPWKARGSLWKAKARGAAWREPSVTYAHAGAHFCQAKGGRGTWVTRRTACWDFCALGFRPRALCASDSVGGAPKVRILLRPRPVRIRPCVHRTLYSTSADA